MDMRIKIMIVLTGLAIILTAISVFIGDKTKLNSGMGLLAQL